MPKRVNNIFLPKLKFKNMLEAYERASEGKHYNKEVVVYELDLASNLIKVLKELYYKKYETSEYRSFTVYEPKERVIKALPFKDRIVQQWYVEEFIKPIFLPKFIETTYACIPTRGVHQAVRKLKQYAYNMAKTNKDFLHLTKLLIYCDDSEKGIPIGNYTSQYFANIYLNVLDHYVKENLHVKYYVRYMDDFAMILNTKEECKEVLKKVETFLYMKLNLELNSKTNYFKAKQGINFCGYKVFSNYILLKKDNKKKIYKRVKKWNEAYNNKTLDLKETFAKLASWEGHAKNADTYNLIKKVRKKCDWLYN